MRSYDRSRLAWQMEAVMVRSLPFLTTAYQRLRPAVVTMTYWISSKQLYIWVLI
jgi:hypothetical protein